MAERVEYKAEFEPGSLVRVADASSLDAFRRTWKYHNPLEPQQVECAGVIARVASIGYYHGGDPLYVLEGLPGVWHEQCLAKM